MKRERTPDDVHEVDARTARTPPSSPSPPLRLEADLNAHPQRVVDKGGSGGNDSVVVNSPYGEHRARYGWGNLFAPARRAVVPGYSNIHIGVSSLNAVPGKSNRVMKPLLQQYRRKFNCLEHCYPYHKVADMDTWRGWAEMVRDSNTPAACHADGDSHASTAHATATATTTTRAHAQHSTTTSPHRRGSKSDVHCVDRFIFTVKANNLLTHVKHLALDAELEAHIDMFFRDRCPALGPFLGPVLVQLPPYFHRTPAHLERLIAFNARLPRREVDVLVQDMTLYNDDDDDDGNDAAADAHTRRGRGTTRLVRHDAASRVRVVRRRLIRIAVEFRHRSWYDEEVFAVLRQLGWSLVVAHHATDATFASHVDTGTSFLYARLHGAVDENVGDYGPVRMNAWAAMVQQFLTQPRPQRHNNNDDNSDNNDNDDVREVYIFLNNNSSHVQETTSSVVDATYLAERLSLVLPPPPPQSSSSSSTTTTSTSPARTQPHAVTTRRSRSNSRTKKSRSNSRSNSRSRSRSRTRSTSSTRQRRKRASPGGTSRARAVKIE